MNKEIYDTIEGFMRERMPANDDCHGVEHVYRVLAAALDLARCEEGVDYDVLIAACLLHDIGRPYQDRDPSLSHAKVGAEEACAYLRALGWTQEKAEHVRDCVRTHSFRAGDPPTTIEAKLLFDADKLDVCGAIGVARTLQYGGGHGEPLYHRDTEGRVLDGSENESDSFFHEYRFKLSKIYAGFYTRRGAALAAARQQAMDDFCAALLREVRESTENAAEQLQKRLES